jgi:hypothetical protein
MNILRGACSTAQTGCGMRQPVRKGNGDAQGHNRAAFNRRDGSCPDNPGLWVGENKGTARAWPSLTFPRQAVEPFAETHKVNYGTEICGVAAGANSLRKRS